jgi:thiamine-phosphate pyrophosphorylase
VGPVYSSSTKDFAELAGLSFVREAAQGCPVPWFALGGIGEDNVEEVLESGATRIAVSRAVVHADRPREAARALRAKLDQIRLSS